MQMEDFDNIDIDDFEEENEKINPLVAAGVFLGLIIVAAFICGILWSATHKEEPINETETVQEVSEENKEANLAALETEVADDEAIEDDLEAVEMAENEATEETQGSEASDAETEENPITESESTEFAEVADAFIVSDSNQVITQDGRVVIFTDCDDYVRPKEYVNLRTEPSTSQGESTVKCQISHADIVHRTGYSADAGWSRVEFYGETLYVVSSYVYNTEAAE